MLDAYSFSRSFQRSAPNLYAYQRVHPPSEDLPENPNRMVLVTEPVLFGSAGVWLGLRAGMHQHMTATAGHDKGVSMQSPRGKLLGEGERVRCGEGLLAIPTAHA